MREKSGVCNGVCSVCNQSGSFPVTHTDNAKICVGTKRPTRWDKTSHPLGQPASTVVTAIDSVANYAICRKRTKTGTHLSGGVGKILTTPYIHRCIHHLYNWFRMSYSKSVCSVCKFHKKIIISLFSSTWPINLFQFVEESCNLVLFLNIFSKILCCFIFSFYFCTRPSQSRSGRAGHNIDGIWRLRTPFVRTARRKRRLRTLSVCVL